MKKYMIFLLLTAFAACSDDDSVSIVKPSDTGIMQDNDGNSYQWIRIDTLDWMTENLHSGIRWYRQGTSSNPKFSYSDSTECARIYGLFGNYYSLSEAVAACPEGWRLPTDDDWKCLERACGMSSSAADMTGWRGGAASVMTKSIEDGGIGLNLKYGGELTVYRSSYPELYHEYDYGLYWTATIDSSQIQRCAYIRKITPGLNEVQRVASPTSNRWASVRYVRTAK